MKKRILGCLLFLSVTQLHSMELKENEKRAIKKEKCIFLFIVKKIYRNVIKPLADLAYQSNADYAELIERV